MAKRVLAHLTPVDWWFVSAKVALGIMWPAFYFSSDPVRPQWTGGVFLWLWCAFTVAGFVVSLAGLVLAAQPRRFRYSGRQIEIAGIWLLLCAPVCYAIMQAALLVERGNLIHGAHIGLSWAIFSFLGARALIVKDGVRPAANRTEAGA